MSAGKIVGGALMFGGCFTATTYLMMYSKSDWSSGEEEEIWELPDVPPTESERMGVFDALSEHYDELLNFDEWFLRMGKYRKYAILQAEGRVLELMTALRILSDLIVFC